MFMHPGEAESGLFWWPVLAACFGGLVWWPVLAAFFGGLFWRRGIKGIPSGC